MHPHWRFAEDMSVVELMRLCREWFSPLSSTNGQHWNAAVPLFTGKLHSFNRSSCLHWKTTIDLLNDTVGLPTFHDCAYFSLFVQAIVQVRPFVDQDGGNEEMSGKALSAM